MRVSHLGSLVVAVCVSLGTSVGTASANTQFYANGGGQYDYGTGVATFGFANTAPQLSGVIAQTPNGYLTVNGDGFQIDGKPDCLVAQGDGTTSPPAVADVYGAITRVAGTPPFPLGQHFQVGDRYALINIFDEGAPTPSNPNPDSFLFATGVGTTGCGLFVGGNIVGIVIHGNVVVHGA
jgi:hypothetical protein